MKSPRTQCNAVSRIIHRFGKRRLFTFSGDGTERCAYTSRVSRLLGFILAKRAPCPSTDLHLDDASRGFLGAGPFLDAREPPPLSNPARTISRAIPRHWRGRRCCSESVSHQAFTSLANHPRARMPIRSGFGKVPAATMRLIVLFFTPVIRSTSGIRNIVSSAGSGVASAWPSGTVSSWSLALPAPDHGPRCPLSGVLAADRFRPAATVRPSWRAAAIRYRRSDAFGRCRGRASGLRSRKGCCPF